MEQLSNCSFVSLTTGHKGPRHTHQQTLISLVSQVPYKSWLHPKSWKGNESWDLRTYQSTDNLLKSIPSILIWFLAATAQLSPLPKLPASVFPQVKWGKAQLCNFPKVPADSTLYWMHEEKQDISTKYSPWLKELLGNSGGQREGERQRKMGCWASNLLHTPCGLRHYNLDITMPQQQGNDAWMPEASSHSQSSSGSLIRGMPQSWIVYCWFLKQEPSKGAFAHHTSPSLASQRLDSPGPTLQHPPSYVKNKLDHQTLPQGGWQNKAGKKRTDEAAQPTQPKNTRSLSLQWPKAPWGLQNHTRGSSGDSGCEKDKADSSEAAVCTLPLTLSNISFWMCFLTSWTFCPLNSSTNITCKDGSGDNFFQNLARNRCHRCSNQYKEVAGAAIFDMQKIRVQVLGFFHYVQSSLPQTSLYTCQHPHRWQTAKSQK